MKYKFNIIYLLILFIQLFLLNSCINLREDYPEIKYYSLANTSNKESREKVFGILQVRNFSSPLSLSGQRILVENPDGSTQRLYYHRWSDNFDQLLTWLVIERLSEQKIFSGGVVSQNSNLVPNYILEGEILNLTAFNHKIPDSSFVELSVKISLLGYNADSTNFALYFTNYYKHKVNRNNGKPNSIPQAVNIAANEIIEKITKDIIKNINQ